MTVCVLKDFTETETNRIIGMAVEVPKGRVFNIYFSYKYVVYLNNIFSFNNMKLFFLISLVILEIHTRTN